MNLTPDQAAFAMILNAVLLLIGIPVAIWGIRTLLKVVKATTELTGALTGFEGTGGLIGEFKSVRKRLHHVESVQAALVIHTGLDNLPERH